MGKIAIIGGGGLIRLPYLKIIDEININTSWGNPSAPIMVGKFDNQEVLFLPRHGNPHTIAPHKINYRANIGALKKSGASKIIAINAVGGITKSMSPCRIVVPDQLIDYTHGRCNTFYEIDLETVMHIDFTEPYSRLLRKKIIDAAAKIELDIIKTGTYAVTQGPRLETAAEIKKLERDGCDIVGMTSMPEASLSRELDIDYACCALVVNWAAGKTNNIITMQIIENNLKKGLKKIYDLIKTVLSKT